MQLVDGGKMVLPLSTAEGQVLTMIERQGDKYLKTAIELVRFVPMLSGKQ